MSPYYGVLRVKRPGPDTEVEIVGFDGIGEEISSLRDAVLWVRKNQQEGDEVWYLVLWDQDPPQLAMHDTPPFEEIEESADPTCPNCENDEWQTWEYGVESWKVRFDEQGNLDYSFYDTRADLDSVTDANGNYVLQCTACERNYLYNPEDGKIGDEVRVKIEPVVTRVESVKREERSAEV